MSETGLLPFEQDEKLRAPARVERTEKASSTVPAGVPRAELPDWDEWLGHKSEGNGK